MTLTNIAIALPNPDIAWLLTALVVGWQVFEKVAELVKKRREKAKADALIDTEKAKEKARADLDLIEASQSGAMRFKEEADDTILLLKDKVALLRESLKDKDLIIERLEIERDERDREANALVRKTLAIEADIKEIKEWVEKSEAAKRSDS